MLNDDTLNIGQDGGPEAWGSDGSDVPQIPIGPGDFGDGLDDYPGMDDLQG